MKYAVVGLLFILGFVAHEVVVDIRHAGKVRFGDKVVVTRGFHEGRTGVVESKRKGSFVLFGVEFDGSNESSNRRRFSRSDRAYVHCQHFRVIEEREESAPPVD